MLRSKLLAVGSTSGSNRLRRGNRRGARHRRTRVREERVVAQLVIATHVRADLRSKHLIAVRSTLAVLKCHAKVIIVLVVRWSQGLSGCRSSADC